MKLMFLNCTDIRPPIACRMKIIPTLDTIGILQAAKTRLQTFLGNLECMQLMKQENALLKRLVYKKSGQIRSAKMLQGLKQVHKSLEKLIELNSDVPLAEFLHDFQSTILEEDIPAYLPSRQTSEYVLVHILRLQAVLSNINSRCKSVFLQVHLHLSTGNLTDQNIVFLALLSRLWICSQVLLSQVCQLYSSLYPLLDLLAATDVPWLPDDQTLPEDISSPEVDISDRTEIVGDELTILLARSSQPGLVMDSDEEDNSQALVGNPVENSEASEDFGVPVSLSDMEVSDEENQARSNSSRLYHDNTNQGQTMNLTCKEKRGLNTAQLQEKVQGAATLRDLRLILKQCQKTLFTKPNTKQKKCAEALASLQRRSKLAERKGNSVRAEKLLSQGKKKLAQLLKSAKLNPASDAKKDGRLLPGATGTKMNKQKKGKKGKMAESKHVDSRTVSSDQKQVKKVKKRVSVQELQQECSGMDLSQTDSPEKMASDKRSPKLSKHARDTRQVTKNGEASLVSTKQQLANLVRSVKRKQQFKLKGFLYELQESEAKELLPDLQAIRSKLKMAKSKEAERKLFVKVTKRLWRTVRSTQDLRSQWKMMKRKGS